MRTDLEPLHTALGLPAYDDLEQSSSWAAAFKKSDSPSEAECRRRHASNPKIRQLAVVSSRKGDDHHQLGRNERRSVGTVLHAGIVGHPISSGLAQRGSELRQCPFFQDDSI